MVEFTSAELTLNLEDFNRRILEPAMQVLADRIRAENPEVFKRLERNKRRRERYAQKRTAGDGQP